MKMNERCKGRIECEHSSVLSFRGKSESFLLRCSAFVIKFNPRLSQLQPIDSHYLSPSVSLLFVSLSVFSLSLLLPLQPSFANGTFISGVAMKCDLWRGVRGVQRTVVCVCACVSACMHVCLWCVYICLRVHLHTEVCVCVSHKFRAGLFVKCAVHPGFFSAYLLF